METGVLTHDSLPTVLRAISQRRRQGVLEVHFTEHQIHLSFVQGRVVEGCLAGTSGPAETLELIRAAGLVTSDAECDVSSYAQLLASLLSHSDLDEVTLKRIVKHRILNHLYSLDAGVSTFYAFKVQMVDYEREYSPNISIGQVLLDLVALETEHQQFEEFFPDGSVVSRGEEENPALSEEESLLYELIAAGGLALSSIERQALLSRYHFETSLLSLLTRNIIQVDEGGMEVEGFPGIGTEALLQALDKSIDDSFETEAMLSTATAVRSRPRATVIGPGVAGSIAGDDHSNTFEEEGSFEAPRMGFGTRCAARSMKLMQSDWIIHLAVLIFLAACVYIPWTFWGEVWKGF